MDLARKVLGWLAWIIIIFLQVIVAFIVGEAAFNLGSGKMPISIILMWLGMTFSIFLIGALTISLHKKSVPKKYLARIGFVALGVLVPLTILAVMGVALNADYEIINGEPDVVLPMLAPILGTLGFYIPTSQEKGLGLSGNKWQRAISSAALYTSPILLLGLAQIFFEEFRPEDAAQLRIAYFCMYAGIWVIIFWQQHFTSLESLNSRNVDVWENTPNKACTGRLGLCELFGVVSELRQLSVSKPVSPQPPVTQAVRWFLSKK